MVEEIPSRANNGVDALFGMKRDSLETLVAISEKVSQKARLPHSIHTWYYSELFQKLTSELAEYNAKNNIQRYAAEFRIRGVVYRLKENVPEFLAMRKISKRSPTGYFWEVTFKGGLSFIRQDVSLHQTFNRELSEEVTRHFDKKLENVYSIVNTILPPEINPDILIRESTENPDIEIYSFIINFILKDVGGINPLKERLGEKIGSVLTLQEHDEIAWLRLKPLREKLLESKELGFDRDYLFYKNFLTKMDFTKTPPEPYNQ